MTKRVSQKTGKASRPFIEKKKQHAAYRFAMKVEEVGRVVDAERYGDIIGAVLMARHYGFVATETRLTVMKK